MEREVLQRMITEYRRKVEMYQAMIAEWEKELGLVAGTVSSSTMTVDGANGKSKAATTGDILAMVRNYQFFGRTQTEAAKALLELIGHPLTTEEIMEGIEKGGVKVGGKTQKDKKQNFYTILNRSKDFGRAGKNTWGLAPWPGIRKPGEKDEQSEQETEQVSE